MGLGNALDYITGKPWLYLYMYKQNLWEIWLLLEKKLTLYLSPDLYPSTDTTEFHIVFIMFLILGLISLG